MFLDLCEVMSDIQARLRSWNDCVHNVGSILPEAVWFLLGLARIDSTIIQMEGSLLPKYKANSGRNLSIDERTQHNTLSTLWIFGAYEVIRTLHQRLRKHPDPSVKDSELCFQIGELKKQFERVRIPLAKFEPAARFPQDGLPIAGVHLDKGATWFVNSTDRVTRLDLSDDLLRAVQEWSNWIGTRR